MLMGLYPIIFDYLIIAALGLSFGSFANVCALRLPLQKNLILSSQCTYCNQPIKFYDNIPIVSFVLLGGKSRCCQKKISLQYPLVEAISLLSLLLIFSQFGYSSITVLVFFLFISHLIIFISDLKFFIIPDLITYSLACIAIAVSFLNMNPLGVSFIECIIGGVIAGAIFFSIAKIFLYLKKIEGLGQGDIKLITALGLWFGSELILIVIILSSLLGAFLGLFLMLFSNFKKTDHLPYGCFIVLSSVILMYAELWLGVDIFEELFSKITLSTI